MKRFEKRQSDRIKIARGKAIMKNERGFSLIEILIAMAIFGIIATGILSGLSISSETLFTTDERQKALSLAQSQMEYVKRLPLFASSYTPAEIPSEYADYSVEIYGDSITSRNANIQKIRVIVSRQGRPIIITLDSTLEGYKLK